MRTLTKTVAAVAAAIVCAIAVAACGSSSEEAGSSSAGGDGATTVRVGVSPYLEYLPWIVADRLGLAAEQDLALRFTTFPGPTEAATAMRRGEVDMIPTCHQCNVPLYRELPELRDWMITNQYKGFIIIGRAGAPTFEELAQTRGPEAAKREILEGLRGATFTIKSVTYKPLLEAALRQVGMTVDDVRIVDFADDGKAALAFSRGEGDYFMGSLPQEIKLLSQEGRFVNVGGQDILGPAGLWYSTMASLEPWLEDNADVVDRLLAVWYRTMRYLAERPDEVLPILQRELNSRAAANFSLDEMRLMTTELDHFMTLDEARDGAFDPRSDLYWKRSADFYNEASRDDLPDDFDVERYVLDSEIFDRLLQKRELVDWVQEPLR